MVNIADETNERDELKHLQQQQRCKAIHIKPDKNKVSVG